MTFKELLESLSARLGAEVEDAGGAAAISIDGATVVLQDAGELLLLRAEIGELPPEGREELLAAALEANWLYQGTGGGTLALDPATGRLNLESYNWPERLGADGAFEALERFASGVAAWRRILADYVPPAAAPAAPAPAGAPAAASAGDFLAV